MLSVWLPSLIDTWYPYSTPRNLLDRLLDRAEALGVEDTKIKMSSLNDSIIFSAISKAEKPLIDKLVEELKYGRLS